MEEIRQPLASFEVDRNAKGDWAFKVKCRADEGETDEDVAKRVEVIVDRFNARYPVPILAKYSVKVKDGSPDS